MSIVRQDNIHLLSNTLILDFSHAQRLVLMRTISSDIAVYCAFMS